MQELDQKAKILLKKLNRLIINQILFLYMNYNQKKCTKDSYLKSNLFIFASTCENLPITLLEGVGAGLLIVSSDYGPMKEVLGNTVCYFDPLKPQTLVEAIPTTINLPLETKNKNLKKLNKITDRFSWQKCTTETFEYIIEH